MELQTNIDSGDVKIKRTSDGTETTITKEKEPDLVTRVSQFKKEEAIPKVEPAGTTELPPEPEFNFKDIENIKDPEAKTWAEKAYKSFQSDYTRKTQALAEEKKKLESQPKPEAGWTPERLQAEMSKPEFIQAAQSIIKNQNPQGSGLTDDEYSALSDREKEKFQRMEHEIQLLKQQTTYQAVKEEDERLKTKYANYNPKAIDTLTADLIAGKVQATREHLHKVLDYEDAIQRGYQLGRQDKNLINQEKITSMSAEGITQVEGEAVPKKEENESNKAYWDRLSLRRLMQKVQVGQVRK